MRLHIVILAAGQGKRMVSDLPKVLHPLAGKPLLSWVYDAALQLNPEGIHIIYGHEGALVRQVLDLPANWVYQDKQLGTGHALLQALPFIPDDAKVLVLSADVPLINPKTLRALLDLENQGLSILTAILDNPWGLGRIIRNEEGRVVAIIEEKDATPTERLIKEIYTGIAAVDAAKLRVWLPKLHANNAQGEYYLTEIIAMAVHDACTIASMVIEDNAEIKGVNDRVQLENLERLWQKRQAELLLLAGVQIADSKRFDLRGQLQCGRDVFIDINCVFQGSVVLGDGCRIGPNVVISNATLGPKTEVHAHCVLEGVETGAACDIGPFARLRPGTKLGDHCKIGNFVETKKAKMGAGTKASHLSYLGDVDIGHSVNIGAGTVTCNYDGHEKHKTLIGDEVFIGSGAKLVAPIKIGAQAAVGAGAVVRKDVPAKALMISENKQKFIEGWKRKTKNPS